MIKRLAMSLTRMTKARVFIHYLYRFIAYLTIVFQVADSCEEEIIREAVQRTVEDFEYIDLEKYKLSHESGYSFQSVARPTAPTGDICIFCPRQECVSLNESDLIRMYTSSTYESNFYRS